MGRPHLDSSYRRSWNAAHWWNGRLLLLLGIVQIYDGLLLYRSDAGIAYHVQMLTRLPLLTTAALLSAPALTKALEKHALTVMKGMQVLSRDSWSSLPS